MAISAMTRFWGIMISPPMRNARIVISAQPEAAATSLMEVKMPAPTVVPTDSAMAIPRPIFFCNLVSIEIPLLYIFVLCNTS